MTVAAPRWSKIALGAAIGLSGLLAISLIAGGVNQYLPHSEDEAAYLFQAQVFALNRLSAPTPPLPDAFWSPFVLDYQGQRFGKYPPGWPLLLSLGVRLGQPWLVNVLLGVVTLGLMAWLGRHFYGDDSASGLPWLAAILTLTTPAFLLQSGSLLSHPAALFWTLLALAALVKAVQRGAGGGWLASVGLCLGLLFLTRPSAALGVGCGIGLFLLGLAGRGELPLRRLGWLSAGSLPVALLLPLYWYAITGSATFNAYQQVWPYDRLGFGPEVGPYGFTLADALFINTRLKLQTLAGGLFGWPGYANLLFLPLPFLARRANRWDWLLLAVAGGVMAVHFFYWAFGGADGGLPRYYYAALPTFVLLTARGIEISRSLPARLHPRLAVMPLLLVGGFVAYNLGWTLPPLLAEQQNKYNITPAPLEIVAQAQLTEPALILVQNVSGWQEFAAPFAANSPLLTGPQIYAIDWTTGYRTALRQQFATRKCWLLSVESRTLQPCPEP